MKCQNVQNSLTAYLDGALDPSEQAQMQAHLATCADCQQELARIEAVQRRVSQSLKQAASRAEPSPQAWAMLQARLERESEPSLSRLDRITSRLIPNKITLGEMIMQRKLKFGLAACMLLVVIAGLFLTRGVTPVSAQQIIDRANAALLAPTATQGIRHVKTEMFQNFQALPGSKSKSQPSSKTITESYINIETGQQRIVSMDDTGTVTDVNGFDGTSVYAIDQDQPRTNPLTVYRSPAPKGWKDIYGYVPGPQLADDSYYTSQLKDTNVTLVGQDTWIDGRSVYVLRSTQIGKLSMMAGQPIDGFAMSYFDTKTYQLVEQKMSIMQAGKEVVITDFQQVVNEILPASTPVTWDMSDVKGVTIVADPDSQHGDHWLEEISQQDLAKRAPSAYTLTAAPDGFSELITAPQRPESSEEQFYVVNYTDKSGDFFSINGPSDAATKSGYDGEIYKTKSGLTINFMATNPADQAATDKPESDGFVQAPNTTFIVASNLPLDRVKALAEGLVPIQPATAGAAATEQK